MKYRIKIERIDNGNEHVHNITFCTNNIDNVITQVRQVLSNEINEHERLMTKYFIRKHSFIKDMVASNNFDKNAVGKDITYEEFIENEMRDAKYD